MADFGRVEVRGQARDRGHRPASACPVCDWTGGFHDQTKHSENQVPAELVLEPGWYRQEHERLKRGLAEAKQAEVKAAGAANHLLAAARLLLALKDGPRDEGYEQAKPLAWEELRIAVAKFEAA